MIGEKASDMILSDWNNLNEDLLYFLILFGINTIADEFMKLM